MPALRHTVYSRVVAQRWQSRCPAFGRSAQGARIAYQPNGCRHTVRWLARNCCCRPGTSVRRSRRPNSSHTPSAAAASSAAYVSKSSGRGPASGRQPPPWGGGAEAAAPMLRRLRLSSLAPRSSRHQPARHRWKRPSSWKPMPAAAATPGGRSLRSSTPGRTVVGSPAKSTSACASATLPTPTFSTPGSVSRAVNAGAHANSRRPNSGRRSSHTTPTSPRGAASCSNAGGCQRPLPSIAPYSMSKPSAAGHERPATSNWAASRAASASASACVAATATSPSWRNIRGARRMPAPWPPSKPPGRSPMSGFAICL
mmetsp:Transcript_23995/g.60379  ORF Transcript_23995/g.60379 Transcript_23995/m.60379 type:complete len:313 (-) Transcript_23995:624-1562(-)